MVGPRPAVWVAAATLPWVLACVVDGDAMAPRGWGETGGWTDGAAETGNVDAASPCEQGLDVPFEGEPADVFAELSGTRESTGTHSDGTTVPVSLTVTMRTQESAWEWVEYGGICWSSLVVRPDLVALSVNGTELSSEDTVRVLSRDTTPMLVVSVWVPAAEIGPEPNEMLLLEVSRTPTAERGQLADPSGAEVLRW